ncbi:TonB-dependent receptor [Sphingomonas nostoxanthinifaciens]|uniref:TonB-dependent receptor n=1 Tax=Sphingomonas nostoxanthinifaciens TaxID=2872652 RepID=UPI001CC1D826|nr:TonB-dependent receptor plug domain-containing protein [Sphingomonas nostoxanthinifaciens]UAK22851.1 TonB-dependent receptor plug domain-containing protein [Sphingomonas nostoxanthinifaciens]
MRSTERAFVAALLAAGTNGYGLAASARPWIPAGSLGEALAMLGGSAGISVGVSDPSLARQRVPGLAGPIAPEAAIRRLIKGLDACLRRIDAQTYRVEPCLRRGRPLPPPPPVPVPDVPSAIIVTASKRQTPATDYAGTALIIVGDDLAPGRSARGSAGIVARLPTLASTNLGPGRNKLFIRGVADSSFNGPTQATVGQYLGDIRLNYNAPDPDLTLYDVAQVEVLEGPQGTLYGAGSLGGIFRIVPEAVDLDHAHGSFAAGFSDTYKGADGSDAAGMLNLPIIDGRVAVRGVAYRSVDGGYIDDVGRGLRDVNRTRTIGGRVALKGELGDGWVLTLSGTLQNIDSADGQYAERNLPRLERRSAVAQPFDNDYALGGITLTKSWGNTRLVSTASVIRHDVGSSYDFTPVGGSPTLFGQTNAILLYSNETRLSHEGTGGRGWLIGSSLVVDEERLTRTLGPVDAPTRIEGVRNTIADAALFGEVTQPVARRLIVTAGARVSLTVLDGQALDQPGEPSEPSRHQVRILPSAGLVWRLGTHGTTLFARVEQGFRPGGLEVSGDPSSQSVQRFHGDLITTWQGGVRAGREALGHVSASASLSYSAWNNIQADLVGTTGLPYSSNIGDGRILGAEGRVGWRPLEGVDLQASIFLNDSELTHPAPAFVGSDASQLPNIPAIGGRIAATYSRRLTERWRVSTGLAARYVGQSRLGVGPLLNIPQGNYLDASADLRIGTERLGFDLSVANLTDTTANTFSLGDPFRVADRLQTTPVRPRTVRFGIDARF